MQPAESYEFFSASGIFKRAHVDAGRLHAGKHASNAQQIEQRNALFDVCLRSGLAHLIVSYVRAEAPSAFPTDARHGVVTYVLKEPIAVQQWIGRTLEIIEQRISESVAHTAQPPVSPHGKHHQHAEVASPALLEQYARQLNGLRSIAMALVGRLEDGSRQVAQSAGILLETSLEDTELAGLTSAGIRHLLELLARIQTIGCACQCMLWLQENQVAVNGEQLEKFYNKARSLRSHNSQEFEAKFGVSARSKEPMLLIENVMQSANVTVDAMGGHLPPRNLSHLLKLLRSPSVVNDILNFYGSEIEREPIEGYFRVQVALLMYFCLDLAYVSTLSHHKHTGARIAHKMRAVADSFAAQLSVRDDMKLTLLALWLIENAVTVNTSSADHTGAIYESAIALLQQSSAMHLHQKYDLEPDLILHVLETLVHRGESLFAWKVWNTFGIDLDQAPLLATELAVVISLEMNLWERSLMLARSRKQSHLLQLVLSWLVRSNRVKDLVQSVTLVAEEEKMFHSLMMDGQFEDGEDVLQDENIKHVDLLVMYYLLRHKYETAWQVHHDHLAMIRDRTAGDTRIASFVLNQPSFRIRAALLANMCPEPLMKERNHELHQHEDVSMDQVQKPRLTQSIPMVTSTIPSLPASAADVEMSGEPEQATLSTPKKKVQREESALVSVTDYSPGIFSTRASQPRASSVKKRSAQESTAKSNGVQIDSSTESAFHGITQRKPDDRTPRKATQALDFGTSPAVPTASFAVNAGSGAKKNFMESLAGTGAVLIVRGLFHLLTHLSLCVIRTSINGRTACSLAL